MTARRQPQRKRTARERLLEAVPTWNRAARRKFLADLREHERDLAERAAEFYVTDISIGSRGSMLAVMQAERLRAAILGPQRKKGAR